MTLTAFLALTIATSGIVVACSTGGGGLSAQPCGGDAGGCPTSLVCSGGYCVASDGDAGASDGSEPDAKAPLDGGARPDAASECVTTVPCSSDLQCATLAGHQCNLGLAAPRCQRLECGADGSPCADESTYRLNVGARESSFCAARSCRHPEPGPWTCRVATLSPAECVAVCLHYNTLQSCSSPNTSLCESTCAMGADRCASRGGLSDVTMRSSCGFASTVCGDGTVD
jgi:hypothetical protein